MCYRLLLAKKVYFSNTLCCVFVTVDQEFGVNKFIDISNHKKETNQRILIYFNIIKRQFKSDIFLTHQ